VLLDDLLVGSAIETAREGAAELGKAHADVRAGRRRLDDLLSRLDIVQHVLLAVAAHGRQLLERLALHRTRELDQDVHVALASVEVALDRAGLDFAKRGQPLFEAATKAAASFGRELAHALSALLIGQETAERDRCDTERRKERDDACTDAHWSENS
jgi:hypothetical protein